MEIKHLWPARLVLTVVFALFAFAVPTVAEYRVEVEQGGVARWDGDGITGCGMDGRTFAPVDGVCYYPVDFERSPDHVEIARWTTAGITTAWLVITEREFEVQEINFPDDSFVHLSAEDLARHYSEQARVKPLFRRGWKSAPRFSIPLGDPAGTLPQGGGFGRPRVFNGEPKNAHTGTDWAINLGTPTLAVADGEILLAEEHFFSGLAVYIDHGHGLISMSFHLSKAEEAGQEVARGDKIGEIGSTGRSTGPHLHLGFRWRGARIDPEWLMSSKAGSMPTVQEAP